MARLAGSYRPRDCVAGRNHVQCESVTDRAQRGNCIEIVDAEASPENDRCCSTRDALALVAFDPKAPRHRIIGALATVCPFANALDTDFFGPFKRRRLPATGRQHAYLVGEIDRLEGVTGGEPPAGVTLGERLAVSLPEGPKPFWSLPMGDNCLQSLRAHHGPRPAAAGVMVAAIGGNRRILDAVLAGGSDAGDGRLRESLVRRHRVESPQLPGGFDRCRPVGNRQDDRLLGFAGHEQPEVLLEGASESAGKGATRIGV